MSDTQTSEWIEHDGKGMPVRQDEFVVVKFRVPGDGFDLQRPTQARWLDMSGGETSLWVFSDKYPEDDIIAYRVVKP